MIISAQRDGRRVARDLGVQSYLAKPFDLDALLSAVEQLCQAAAQPESAIVRSRSD